MFDNRKTDWVSNSAGGDLDVTGPDRSGLASAILSRSLQVLFLATTGPNTNAAADTLILTDRLTRVDDNRILLISTDRSTAGFATRLNLRGRHNFHSLLFDDNAPPLLRSYIIRASDLPFSILPGNQRVHNARRLATRHLDPLLSRLNDHCHFIIVSNSTICSTTSALIVDARISNIVVIIHTRSAH